MADTILYMIACLIVIPDCMRIAKSPAMKTNVI